MEIFNPISAGASADGWVACFFCDEDDEDINTLPVIVWSVCEVYEPRRVDRDGMVHGWRRMKQCNEVCGIIQADTGLVPANEIGNFVGYMRQGERPDDQEWFGTVQRLRGRAESKAVGKSVEPS